MKVYLNEMTGIADAITSMLMSKRSWTREKEEEIRNLVNRCSFRNGEINPNASAEDLSEFMRQLNITLKWGKKHITLLRYIDFSFTVEGLHRAGQDDWDSHAQRFNNRIVRSSTRLAKFNGTEKSDYYKDKVLHIDDLIQMGLISPMKESIEVNGTTYVYTTNGYVREDLKDNKDALRGLYTLDIPSNFIFKVNLTELAHVIKERDINSNANPEVKELAEAIKQQINDWYSQIDTQLFYDIKN